MDSFAIKNFLTEYENKRRLKIRNSEEKKALFLREHPEIEKIEDEISKSTIEYSKALITAPEGKKEELLNKINSNINELKNKKEAVLKKLGINSTFFEPEYDCKICNDTGYVLNNNKSEMCSCLKQKIFDFEYNKSNIGNIEKENFKNFSLDKYSDEINEEKYHTEISPRENIKNIKKICENFINNFDNPDEKNLLFTGNTGLGKTFLSNCIAYEMLKKGKTVLYQTAPVMLDSIIDYRFGKTNANNSIVDNLLNVDLLIIDDLGTETMNNMKFTELFNIINTRILNQNNKITKTIISTNLNLNNIFSIYEERLGSRFIGHYNICKFFGDDIRFIRK